MLKSAPRFARLVAALCLVAAMTFAASSADAGQKNFKKFNGNFHSNKFHSFNHKFNGFNKFHGNKFNTFHKFHNHKFHTQPFFFHHQPVFVPFGFHK